MPLPAEYSPLDDDHCDVAPSCLDCPLPLCRYDLPERIGELGKYVRRVVWMRENGQSYEAAAKEFGVAKRVIRYSQYKVEGVVRRMEEVARERGIDIVEGKV